MDKYGRKHTDGSRSGGQPVDIRAKALALLNEVWKERGYPPEDKVRREDLPAHEALCRAIEAHEADKVAHAATIEGVLKSHEAFKQKVSDVVEGYLNTNDYIPTEPISQFIIPKPKPDPLERLLSVTSSLVDKETLRDRLEAEGLEIRSKNDGQRHTTT